MTASPSTATTINTYKFSIGVGTEHTYTYDINERLKSATLTLHKDIISTNTYTYDKTDNITGIRGVSESLYNQKYTYDDMNRLTGASGMDTGGKSDDGSAFSSYVMTMSYDQMSSPQRYELTKMSQSDTKVTENEYLYSADSSNPHAPMQIGDMTYTYSASGNPLTIEGSKISRTLTWDSENRLRELTDQRRGIQSRYTYNHRGERSLKRYGAYESMAVNGVATGSLLDPKSAYSAYVSPYYVEHGRGTESGAVTKHYYAGAERLASKVVTSATGAKGESQNGTQSSAQTEESTYYYFTDHLGSTTHITDKGSKVVQYAAYTPYGTLFREYKSVMPYKFNGKELDQETGYYYYGARYYDPTTALWLGVDPMQMKYPDIGAYVYCAGNPVKYVDPDGRWPWENRNIRDARAFASQNGFEVQLIDGKYGKDAVVVKDGNVVTTYSARLSEQKTWYDNLDDHHNDCANLGTITTSDVRAVADLCEGVSDACDAVGTGLLTTGVGAGAGAALYTAGTVAGSISEAISIGVDLYEGKYKNALVRGLNGFVTSKFGKIINSGYDKSDMFLQKALDKMTDSFTNLLIE